MEAKTSWNVADEERKSTTKSTDQRRRASTISVRAIQLNLHRSLSPLCGAYKACFFASSLRRPQLSKPF
nr:hypothetical protein CFP56_41834 [Quercus suber]